MMDETMDSLQAAYDACAGAGYSVSSAFLLNADPRKDEHFEHEALFYWLMMAEAIARSDRADTILAWLQDHLHQLSQGYPWVEEGLKREFSSRWVAWLPLLFFLPSSKRTRVWNQFHEDFPSPEPQQDALRTVLFHFLGRNLKSLFLPDDWRGEVKNAERYTSPDACVIVNLGLTLAKLANESEKEQRTLFEEWTHVIKSKVLRRLPERISPGFAPEWPLFQDMVLAVLSAAEWLLQAERSQVAETIRENQTRLNEWMTENQLVLASGLYGWIQGYHSVAGWIERPNYRQALSRQAMCLAIQQTEGQQRIMEYDPIIFYCTPEGDRYNFCKPYAALSELEHREKRIIASQEKIIPISDTLEIQLAGGVFHFKITLEHLKS